MLLTGAGVFVHSLINSLAVSVLELVTANALVPIDPTALIRHFAEKSLAFIGQVHVCKGVSEQLNFPTRDAMDKFFGSGALGL